MSTTFLKLEELEGLTLPASFGIPWSDTNLTLSFAPDGTSISHSQSNLFSSLNQFQSTEVWQAEILLAYQTWLQHTNLNLTVVSDSGASMGAVGHWQNDPRFGDIRIFGTNLHSNVLAIGTPPDPGLAGTRAGDVIINTAHRFNTSTYDLYSLMLHEAGHSLGIGNSSDPNSVMLTQFAGKRSVLSPSDIQAIQSLYGPRSPDIFEGTNGNNRFSWAYDIGALSRSIPNGVELIYGDLTTHHDVDFYSFLSSGGSNDQNLTVKLQTRGFSLASAKLTVFEQNSDGSLSEVGNAKMNPDSVTGDEISVTFDSNDDQEPRRFFIRVEKSDDAKISIGRYALAIAFENDDDDDDDDDDDGNFSEQDLTKIWQSGRPIRVNGDNNQNNTRRSATILSPQNISQSGQRTRSEIIAHLDLRDRDFYRVQSPAGVGPRVLTVNVQSLDLDMALPVIRVYDSANRPLSSIPLVAGSSNQTLQVTNLNPSENYFIEVFGSAGNYRLTVDFGLTETELVTLADGELPMAVTKTDTLYIAQAQMMHLNFLADAVSAPNGAGVQITIRDSHGNIVHTLFSPVGQMVSADGILFRAGEYQIEYVVVRPNNWNGPLRMLIRGNRTDDPIGVQPTDPTFAPIYLNPLPPPQSTPNPSTGLQTSSPETTYYPYLYPNGILSFNPFYWVSILSK